ncbi:MAG: hypothetical protein M3083_04395 [Actinomycetota bacterium]|nr:hypothetical protein [Actinomycetota bacterium]MDQ6949800.1 hypothetical protein [Actinomycetota bacterium]
MVDDDEAALAAARDRLPAASAPITRSSQLGPAARPVSVPDDMSGPKATGRVTLPLHVYWSGPDPSSQVWDLDDRRQRAHLYEIVLREGTVDDVRHFIDLDLLADLWDELFLPEAARRVWARPLAAHADPAAGR